MYRSAAKRLLPALCRQGKIPYNHVRSASIISKLPRFSTSSTGESFPNQNPSTHFDSASASSSSTSSNAFSEEVKGHSRDQDGRSTRTSRPERTDCQDEEERVLRASLSHVVRIFLCIAPYFPLYIYHLYVSELSPIEYACYHQN